MKNRDLQLGSDFMYRSYYDIASLQVGRNKEYNPPQQPLPCKLYQNVDHYSLQCIPALTLGDARWSFPAFREMKRDQPIPYREVLDEESLSTLLYYTYGFSRHDEGPGVAWPFHRFVPSARCLFPAELYLWLPHSGQMPAGLYSYDAHHHRLAFLRPGDARPCIGNTVAASLDHCLGILLISTLFWKNAFKYRNFSYRLCTQEAGLVVGNALLVAGTLGIDADVYYQFLDQPLNQLLGFEPEEESLMVVMPLYAWQRAQPRTIYYQDIAVTSQALCNTIPPLHLHYIKRSALNQEVCSTLIALDQHSWLETTAEFVSPVQRLTSNCNPTEERLSLLEPRAETIELAQALYTRSSGDADFTPRHITLSQQAFWDIVRYSLSPYICDIQQAGSSPFVHLYLVISNVEGLDPGIYRFCAHCDQLHVIARNDPSLIFQTIQQQGNITSASACMCCYIVADYTAMSTIFGNRAYRIVHLETGVIAQRLCVMCAAHGLVARYSNSYDVAQCKALLYLANSDVTPLTELVIGYEQPGAHTANRYRFSLLS